MQKVLAHWPPAVHGRPTGFAVLVQLPAPSHCRPWSGSETQAGTPTGSSSPDGTNEQVPRLLARLHCLHLSLQAVSQQTPSAQLPLAQSAGKVQACPIRFLHFCVASQAWSEGQVSSGKPAGTLTQVPGMPATLQDLQVPSHWAAVCAQQTPSTQLPDMQLDAVDVRSSPAPSGRAAVFGRYSQNSDGPYVVSSGTVPPKR